MLFRDEILPEREDFLFVMWVILWLEIVLMNIEYLN